MNKQKKQTATLEPEPITIDGVITPEELGQVPATKGEAATEPYKIVEAEIVQQIVAGMREHFTPDLCYNKPVRTKSGGKLEWRECDMMRTPCKYKGKDKHIHIVGIGYHGAMEAVQIRGDLKVDIPDPPTVVEEAGRLFWRVKATCTDLKTGSQVSRWHMKPYYDIRAGSVVESEHAMLIVQSLAARNVVLATISHALQKAWIQDYRDGVRKFKKQAGRKPVAASSKKQLPETGEGTEKPKATEPEKPKEKQPMSKQAKAELQAAVNQTAERLGSNAETLMEFASDPGQFQTSAKAILLLMGSANDSSKLQQLQTKMKEWWEERQAAEEAAKEAAKADEQGEPVAGEEVTMEGPATQKGQPDLLS